MDMMDVIVLGQISKCFDEGRTVIGDYFTEHTPSAEYVFKYLVAYCLTGFCAKQAVLREVGE